MPEVGWKIQNSIDDINIRQAKLSDKSESVNYEYKSDRCMKWKIQYLVTDLEVRTTW